jgi:hypothetical protein
VLTPEQTRRTPNHGRLASAAVYGAGAQYRAFCVLPARRAASSVWLRGKDSLVPSWGPGIDYEDDSADQPRIVVVGVNLKR